MKIEGHEIVDKKLGLVAVVIQTDDIGGLESILKELKENESEIAVVEV